MSMHGRLLFGPYVSWNKLASCFHSPNEDLKSYSFQMWVIEEFANESGKSYKSYSCTKRYSIETVSYVLRPVSIWRTKKNTAFHKNCLCMECFKFYMLPPSFLL